MGKDKEARVGVVDVKLRKDWRDFVACTFWAATGDFESRCELISRCFPSRKQELFAAMLAGKESLSQMATYKSKLDCGSNLTMQPYSDSEELTVMYSMRTWRDEQGRQPTFNLLHEAMLSIDGEAPAELMVSGLASNYDIACKSTSVLGNDWTLNVTSGYADGFNPLTDGAIGNIYPLLWWQAEETDDPREGIALNLCKGESGDTLELCGFCERAEIQSLLQRIREGSSDLRGAEIQEWCEDPSTRWT
ncbi:hypothetical protein [Novipirellula caenicola]|uniref:Suppressor of fused protein (SUFU) n=1 Tax=Novipirellula caenicola TaxID=1536901 RepID=A0ABP9W1K4_9BACT